MSIQIPPEARRMAKGTGLEGDEGFVLAVATALADLGSNARRGEVIETASAQRIRELTAERDASDAEGRKVGALAERARIEAILTAKEAEGRETVARSLAFNSDLPAVAAVEALKTAPKASAMSGWATQPAQPTEAIEGLLRSADAPGGLVIMGADGKPALAEQAAVSVSPSSLPRADENPAKQMWRSTIAAMNAETKAGTAPAR